MSTPTEGVAGAAGGGLRATGRAGVLLVVGDANPDLVLRGDVVPRFGQAEQLLDAADLVLGGSAAIMAHGAARLGVRTRLTAAVGSDLFGTYIREVLASADVFGLQTVGAATGLSVILSGPADRAILTRAGAIDSLTVDDVNLDGAAHLHVSSYFLMPRLAAGLPELFARARARGVTTSLDTNWDPAGRWAGVRELLALTDVFLPNRAELDGIGADPEGLAAAGTTVVLKEGAAGARAWWPGESCAVAAPAGEIVDTTGAGDSFDAGFLAGYLAGAPVPRCVAMGVAAGSLSTRAAGGTAAQPTMPELLAVLDGADVAGGVPC